MPSPWWQSALLMLWYFEMNELFLIAFDEHKFFAIGVTETLWHISSCYILSKFHNIKDIQYRAFRASAFFIDKTYDTKQDIHSLVSHAFMILSREDRINVLILWCIITAQQIRSCGQWTLPTWTLILIWTWLWNAETLLMKGKTKWVCNITVSITHLTCKI